MPEKAERLPWETTPYIDPEAAQTKALKAVQPREVDPRSPVVQKYARSGFDREIASIRDAPKGQRQKLLFPAAAALYELVAAEALDEAEVENAIREACRQNRLEQDDGEPSISRTLVNARRKGFDAPRNLTRVGQGKPASVFDLDDDGTPQPVVLADVYDLEQGFWTSRESLQTIYLASMSGMASPWAVLGQCAARALALVRPHCTLPPIIGGKGSLNWFVALAGKSGGGKGSSGAVADLLVPHDIQRRGLGSGEGLLDQYVKPGNKETGEPPSTWESILFVAEEVDGLKSLNDRTGNTMSALLRSGFSGETLGFSYRNSNSKHLPKHSYRMTLIVGVQPARADAIMGDKYGGTLQRFMWFPAEDSRITEDTPSMPPALELPRPNAWQYPMTIGIPYEAVELIKNERVRAMRGELENADGHALFVREKFAMALAVLDGRTEVTLEDWRLSGIARQVSDFTRRWVSLELIKAMEDQAEEKGRLQGVQVTASNEERTVREAKRITRIATWALKAIGPDGMSNRDLNRAVASRDRPYLPMALEKLQQAGRIGQNESKKWVRSQ